MKGLLLALGVLVMLWLLAVLILVLVGQRTHARELATILPNLIRLFAGLIGDERVPRSAKVLVGLAGAWLISPIDLIPEFIPLLGPLDDVVIAALVLRHILRRAGPEVIRDHWRGEDATLHLVLRIAGYAR